jgi:hypothetical protein
MINLTDMLMLRVLMGTSWSGADSLRLVWSPIPTVAGPVILIMHQYAHSGKGHSIHSLPQLEWNGVDVDDKSARVSGKQRLVTFDGFSIPINI